MMRLDTPDPAKPDPDPDRRQVRAFDLASRIGAGPESHLEEARRLEVHRPAMHWRCGLHVWITIPDYVPGFCTV
jgi:hypothetical protein